MKKMKKIMMIIFALHSLFTQSYAAFNEPSAQPVVVDVGQQQDFFLTTQLPVYPLGGWDGNGNNQWNRYTIKNPLAQGITIYKTVNPNALLNGDRIWEGHTFRIVAGPNAILTTINYNVNRTTTQGGDQPIPNDVVKQGKTLTVRVNAKPVIPVLINQNINVGQSKNVSLGITDPGDPNPTQISAFSSNPTIVQVVSVMNNSVNLKALKPGNVTITVKANDTRLEAQGAFSVEVPNTAPTISAISAQKVASGAQKVVNFNVFDAETSPNALTVSATSDNQAIVPEANFVFGNQGQMRSLTFTGQNPGLATITVKVSDGQLSAQTFFEVTVTPPNQVPTLENNTMLTVGLGGTKTITSQNLKAVDADNSSQELIYVVQNLPAHGILKKNGAPTTSFSQADVDAALVSYSHNGDTNALTDEFDFQVGDQINPNLGPFSFAINIVPFDTEETGSPDEVIDMILTNGLDWITNGMPGVSELIQEKGLGYFKGKYQGLSASSPWVQETAGFVNVKLKKSGKAKVIHKKVSDKLRWKDDFNQKGVWFKRRGNELFALALTTNKQIYGYITNTAGIRPPSAIVANMAYYDAKNNLWPGQRRFLVSVSNDTNTLGKGLLKVNKAGVARLNLGLSDNSKVKHKARIAKNGTWPLFKPLFKKQGCIQSFGNISSNKATNAVTGEVYLQEPLGLQKAELVSQ
ncbi:MAG: cadherin-like domain-containing protein [Verrucomicrobiia bacterium]